MPQPRHTESSILQSYLLTPSPLPTILPYSSFLQLVPSQHRSHPDLKRLYRDLQFQRNIDVDTVRENIEREVKRGVALKANLRRRIADEQGHAPPNSSTASRSVSRKRKRAGNHRRADDDEDDSQHGGGASSSDSDGDHGDDRAKTDLDDVTNPVDTAIDTTYYNTSLHPSHAEPDPASSRPKSNHPLTTGAQSITRSKYHTASSLLASMSSAISDLDDEIAELDSESERLLSEMNEIVGSLSDLRYGRFAKPMGGGDEDGGSGGGGTSTTLEEEIVEALEGLGTQARAVLMSSVANE